MPFGPWLGVSPIRNNVVSCCKREVSFRGLKKQSSIMIQTRPCNADVALPGLMCHTASYPISRLKTSHHTLLLLIIIIYYYIIIIITDALALPRQYQYQCKAFHFPPLPISVASFLLRFLIYCIAFLLFSLCHLVLRCFLSPVWYSTILLFSPTSLFFLSNFYFHSSK